jgi:predicted short-subunit dehydrogenase-like oxidoreductase (DUF2520 family)
MTVWVLSSLLMTRRVHILGAGNVGWHLAQAFQKADVPIGHVWSRHPENARQLARIAGGAPITDLQMLQPDEGLWLIAVADLGIGDVVAQIPDQVFQTGLWAHTSGASPLDLLPEGCAHRGVFYPLQTFTKDVPVAMSQVPILITARTPVTEEKLSGYARLLSERCVSIPEADRPYIHLAAVFVNNFVNHIGGLGREILENRYIDGTILTPLIDETVRKMTLGHPRDMQTGPAIRGDINTLQAHLRLLADRPELAALYRLISQSINPLIKL